MARGAAERRSGGEGRRITSGGREKEVKTKKKATGREGVRTVYLTFAGAQKV